MTKFSVGDKLIYKVAKHEIGIKDRGIFHDQPVTVKELGWGGNMKKYIVVLDENPFTFIADENELVAK